MNILFIGDVVGRPGRKILREKLSDLIKKYSIDVTICNAENAAGGLGLTHKVAEELYSSGIDYMTTGNHVWDKKDAFNLLNKDGRILRPLNYPQDVPGRGWNIFKEKNGVKIGIINALGRIFLECIDCPFKAVERAVEKIKEETPVVIVDFHAEATSEKIAFGWHFAGKVSAVIGTHTHVQTADEKILMDYTGYISDVGMTGPVDSVLGVKKELVIRKFLTGMPVKFEISNSHSQINALVLKINNNGKTSGIERIQIIEKS